MATVSEDELDDFFRRRDAVRLPSESVPPPSKRRKSSHQSSSASEDDEDDASDASSELEIVGGSSSKKKAAAKAKSRAKQSSTAGRRGKAPLAAPRPLETSKKATKLLSVDSSSPESSPDRGVRSNTQMLAGGDALEAMARQLGGWKGEGRPPRVKAADKAAAAAGPSTSESPEAARTSKRHTSASTGATSLSDKSSSAAKAKGKTKASPRTTKKAPATKKKARAPSSSPPIELEPEQFEQPPPPESFWGVKEALPGESATKQKRVHGEASKRLQEMSKLPALRPPDGDDDDIASSEETDEEEDAPPKKYETVAAKAKRERQEALAAQKAKREAKAKAAAAPPKPAAKPAAAQSSILASFQKRSCPVCNSTVPAGELEEHTQQCIAALESQQTQEERDIVPPPKPQPKPPPPPPPAPALPKKAPPPRSPSPPKRPITNRASSHDGYIESSQALIIEPEQEKSLAEELFPPSPSPKRTSAAAKGKGRAVVQEEPEPEEDYDMNGGDENWPYEEEEDDDYGGEGAEAEEFDYDEDGEGGEIWEDPADFARLHGTTREVIEIGSDDDETVQVAAKARMGGGGAVNTSRAKGPPKDGSPPPTGSLYISTMPHAMRLGYAQMYRERSPKKGAPDRNDPLAPQKMTAAPKAGFRGKARRGGWGRGRGRGARRGARGRK